MARPTFVLVLPAAALGVVAVLPVLGLAGCANPQATDLKSITSNLTPELMTTSERPDDVSVNWAMNANQDLRSGWSDLGRFWLTDRPSNLSPFPIMSTGGQP